MTRLGRAVYFTRTIRASAYVEDAIEILLSAEAQITERRLAVLGRFLAWIDAGARGRRPRLVTT